MPSLVGDSGEVQQFISAISSLFLLENVKSSQTDGQTNRQTDGKTDGQRTTRHQKRSLEIPAQVN